MDKRLYFIPILETAFRSSSLKTALFDAFEEIERLGKEDDYREGYQNFKLFMEESKTIHEQMEFEDEFSSEIPDRALEEIKNIYRSTFADSSPIHHFYRITIRWNNQPIHTFDLPDSHTRKQLELTKTGTYSIALNTGQVLWKKEIGESFFILRKKTSPKRLKLAAKTTSGIYQKSLAGGDLLVRIIPGEDQAALSIEFCSSGERSS